MRDRQAKRTNGVITDLSTDVNGITDINMEANGITDSCTDMNSITDVCASTDGNENVNDGVQITPRDKPFVDWAEGKFTPLDNELLWNEKNHEVENENESITRIGVCMALTLNNENVPKSWKQAVNMHELETAMKNEINELQNKKAWELVPRPKNKKVLPGVWNFRAKKDEKGNVVKYKAR